MTNYVTKNQVFKGAWAVFLVLITVAGWSFKVFADHSSSIARLETNMEMHIGIDSEQDQILSEHTESITKLRVIDAEQIAHSAYMTKMIEMLLEKEKLPLPLRPNPDER